MTRAIPDNAIVILYSKIEKMEGAGWLPRLQVHCMGGRSAYRIEITDADVSRRPSDSDFRMDFPEPVRVIDNIAHTRLAPKKSWSLKALGARAAISRKLAVAAVAPMAEPEMPGEFTADPSLTRIRVLSALSVLFILSGIGTWVWKKRRGQANDEEFGNSSLPGERAFTLLETLVSVAVIGTLAALLLPAIQSAREASRRLECQNHLKQIGLAMNSYHSVLGCFPGVDLVTKTFNGPPYFYSNRYYSGFTHLLPFLDQPTLFHGINFALSPVDGRSLVDNSTVMTTRVAGFLCPSDALVSPSGYARVNYRFSLGPTHLWAPASNIPESWSGPFTVHRAYKAADFTDGLSNTVGISERLQGDWQKFSYRPRGDYLLPNVSDDGLTVPDQTLRLAARLGQTLPKESRGGESWFLSGFHYTCYNHCAPPSNEFPDFAFRRGTGTVFDRVNQQGVFKASSLHPGVVNVLAMDGSARPVSSSINLQTWRSLATRGSGDFIAAEY